MPTEYEVRILDIDVEHIKKKLQEIKATFIAGRNMRRYVYLLEKDDSVKHKWLRLRDNGEKVTLAVKEIRDDTITGTQETEVVVNDFEMTNKILISLGFKTRAYEENKRISYILDDVEIEIDTWPKIPAYVEIEWKSAEDVQRIVELLGFKMSDTTAMNTYDVYMKYGIDISTITELKF